MSVVQHDVLVQTMTISGLFLILNGKKEQKKKKQKKNTKKIQQTHEVISLFN